MNKPSDYLKKLLDLTMISMLAILAFAGCSHKQDIPVASETTSKDTNLDYLKRDVVKIAAGQVNLGEGCYEVMLEFIDRAGAEGADLIVLPEYIAGLFSLPLKDSHPISRIADAARKNKIYVIVGGWEEFEEGALNAKKQGGFSNTALLFNRKGEVAGRFCKVHPAVGEAPHWWPPLPDQAEWLMKAGDKFPVFTTDFGRIGIMTCYDGYFPEAAEILSLHGAEIIAWINGRGGPIEKHLVQSDIQRNYSAMVATNLGQGSGTLISQNFHELDSYVEESGNHYISQELDMKALRELRAHSRVHHQRRPDLYESITKEHATWKVYESRSDLLQTD